jgi:uncharacterized protein YgiB involved in biofilm formation
MKRSSSINIARMVKWVPHFVLAPVAAAVLSACGDAAPEPEKFLSNVDDCSGMPSRQAVTQCEAAYYKAIAKAEKELPRFTSREECEKIYGTCEAPPAQSGQQAQNSGSNNSNSADSFLVPAMAGYIAAQMVNDLGDGFRDRSHYYRDLERRKREREYDQLYGTGYSQPGYSSTTANNGAAAKNSNHQPKPKVAPPPAKPKQPAKTESRGGWGSSAGNKNSWGGGSKGSGWGG